MRKGSPVTTIDVTIECLQDIRSSQIEWYVYTSAYAGNDKDVQAELKEVFEQIKWLDKNIRHLLEFRNWMTNDEGLGREVSGRLRLSEFSDDGSFGVDKKLESGDN